ncbi:hypothetical protein RvY_08312-2 [Ramazzottius varieornatus]|uniref:Uncharacterized protein n=1 Tax=Ramazzottius varieornatus TaxID=947166 RepID=A0A1D1V5E4_RAMVA|nr:hypothetical protein RvY_08312-2 [Ramazzottius varieornatus]
MGATCCPLPYTCRHPSPDSAVLTAKRMHVYLQSFSEEKVPTRSTSPPFPVGPSIPLVSSLHSWAIHSCPAKSGGTLVRSDRPGRIFCAFSPSTHRSQPVGL